MDFQSLGLLPELCEACAKVGWKTPTAIQVEAIPLALKGRDLIGLAETGSGKTGAFGLPILQSLLLKPQRLFALIIAPTRELAVQIKEELDKLGNEFGLSCCAVVGGISMSLQSVMLLKKPHIVVATLGRLIDHVKHTKSFSLSTFKHLVIDEADNVLADDFASEMSFIVNSLPSERTTMLFSATITSQIKALQRAHLKDAVKVEVNNSFKVVDSLKQYFIPMPLDDKHAYLLYLLREFGQNSVIVFCNTRLHTVRTTLVLRHSGHQAIPLYGEMTQAKRLDAISKFRLQDKSVLVATNVASRGLDIPCVDYVINLEVPLKSEDYIHRVGRTARAGRPGVAITFVSQYELESFLRIEHLMNGRKFEPYTVNKSEVNNLLEKALRSERIAKQELRQIEEMKEKDDKRPQKIRKKSFKTGSASKRRKV